MATEIKEKEWEKKRNMKITVICKISGDISRRKTKGKREDKD